MTNLKFILKEGVHYLLSQLSIPHFHVYAAELVRLELPLLYIKHQVFLKIFCR